MRRKQSIMVSGFLSGNLKSKIQNLKWAGIITVGVTLAMCGAVAEAQQAKKIPRVGFLLAGGAPSPAPARPIPTVESFRQGLRELGYVEGKNIIVEYRAAGGKFERLPDLAAELVRLKVDVVVTAGTPSIRAAQHATNIIPIVMANVGDPIAAGFGRYGVRSSTEALPNHASLFPLTFLAALTIRPTVVKCIPKYFPIC